MQHLVTELAIGETILFNGVALTLVDVEGDEVSFRIDDDETGPLCPEFDPSNWQVRCD